jgi:hypothetical protein
MREINKSPRSFRFLLDYLDICWNDNILNINILNYYEGYDLIFYSRRRLGLRLTGKPPRRGSG